MGIAATIAAAQLQSEARRPTLATGMLALSAGAIVLLQLALAGSGKVSAVVGAGASWVVLLLAAVTVLGSAVGQAAERGSWDAALLTGGSRWAVAAGHTAALVILLWLLHAVAMPLTWVTFAAPTSAAATAQFVASVALADLGLAAVAVLAGMVAMHSRGRELVAPALLIPLSIPVLIAGVSIAAHAVEPAFVADPGRLIGFLAVYDAVMLLVLWGSADYLAER